MLQSIFLDIIKFSSEKKRYFYIVQLLCTLLTDIFKMKAVPK